MTSSVPSFSLSRLRAAFSASWNWSNRPAYQFKIRHQFELGGFDVKAGPGVDLDRMGLEWMRTLELSSRTTGIEYRMILFDDLDVILPGFPGPSPEMLEKMYGTRFDRSLFHAESHPCCTLDTDRPFGRPGKRGAVDVATKR